jgi:benzoylformate decarboxylase
MARAFKEAQTPPTGPVFLSLPVNVMEERADVSLPPVTRVGGRIHGDPVKIEEAAGIISEARNPVIIAGDRVARSGAVLQVAQLAETMAARVHSEPLNSLLVFPTDHPLYAGALFPNAAQARATLEGADVILTIGVNNLVPLVYTGLRIIPDGARLIQIDADGRELGKNYPAEVAIQADPRAAAEDLIKALGSRSDETSSPLLSARRQAVESHIRAARAKFAAAAAAQPDDGPMSPGFVARAMRRAVSGSPILVDESVTSTAFVRTLFDLSEPNSYFYAKGGSLGLGLPAAVGVKLAMPDRQVICAVGDGSALYSIQALWTAARYNLAVRFVVFNNASYMILKGGLAAMQGESIKRGKFVGMDITEPEVNFVSMAESMGVGARRVARPAELRAALDWAFNEGGPTLLDVAISRDVRSVLR